MNTLKDVAERLVAKAQNEADIESLSVKDSPKATLARFNMLLFIDMAEIINKHISECPQCKQ